MRRVIVTPRGYLLDRKGHELSFTMNRDKAMPVTVPNAHTILQYLRSRGLIGEVQVFTGHAFA